MPSQQAEIPKRWLSKLYRSVEMLPFVASSGGAQAIVPVDTQGKLDLDSAMEQPGWETLDGIYRRFRGKGQTTPKALAKQIDFAGKLSSQPRLLESERRMVLYLGSGDVMRSARTFPGSGCVGHTLFWHIASSEDEAAYLTVLLNAPSLRRAFFESRESGRHFQLHPWRKVPIPRYDGKNRWHIELAELCRRAEDAAQITAAEVQKIHPNAGPMKLSNAVRKRLEVDGIFPSVDKVAARLLPDQAGIDFRSAPS